MRGRMSVLGDWIFLSFSQGPMPPQLAQLARTLSDLTRAHRDLCDTLDAQQAAMQRFDTTVMADVVRRQESIHRRILRLETERRKLVAALAKPLRLPPNATLAQLVAGHPEHADALLDLRNELRRATAEAAQKSRLCGRVAGSVLSHLNGALRLLTNSVVYRRTGDFDAPPPTKRRVEAVA